MLLFRFQFLNQNKKNGAQILDHFFFFLNQAAHVYAVCMSVPSSFHRASAACLLVLIFLLVLQIVPVSVGSVYKRSGLGCAFVLSAFNVVGFMDLFVFVLFFWVLFFVPRTLVFSADAFLLLSIRMC